MQEGVDIKSLQFSTLRHARVRMSCVSLVGMME
jgi:hypothetical protein